jgi:hypothetical protein
MFGIGLDRRQGTESVSRLIKQIPAGGTVETVVTHLGEAPRQNMLKEAGNKLLA